MKLALLMALLAVMFLTGCGTFPDQNGVDSGTSISRVAAENLRPGVDTYPQVIAEFGPPLLQFDGQRVIAYLWHHPGTQYPWLTPDKTTRGQYQAFGLVFDDRHILQRHAFFSDKDWQTLRQQILDWAKIHPPPP